MIHLPNDFKVLRNQPNGVLHSVINCATFYVIIVLGQNHKMVQSQMEKPQIQRENQQALMMF